jgi:hypothetical protein
MTIASSKTYENSVNTAPHPAGYCVSYTPSASAVFDRPSRWLMITDTTAKIVNLRLGGVKVTKPAAIAGIAGDISMATGGVLNSTLGTKFNSIVVNDTVVVSGFSNPTNNGTFQVTVQSGTSLTLRVPGSVLAPNTVVETPSGTAANVQGPNVGSQHTISFTALAGVMYPICADQLLAATTTAAGVLAFY